MIVIAVIAALITFYFFKNKQYNRNVERHNRMVDKQEELMEILRKKTQNKNETNEQTPNNTTSGDGNN